MRALRLSSSLAIVASLVLSSACSADEVEQTGLVNLQSSLSRLNLLLQDANLNPDDELITHASSIIQRVRKLVQAPDDSRAEMVREAKKDRVEQRKQARRDEQRMQRRRAMERRRATEQEESRSLLRGGGIGNGEIMEQASKQGLELEVQVAALHLRWLLDQLLDETPS